MYFYFSENRQSYDGVTIVPFLKKNMLNEDNINLSYHTLLLQLALLGDKEGSKSDLI